jgi:SpoVK/Ycf46/Vps4 family AAA+-type ATPase
MSGSDRILVLGATNRPNDIDSAILRRMPKRFAVGLPNIEQRTKILNLMLKDTKLSPDFSIEKLATLTEGLSGSDLRELCRNAAMVPVREFMRSTSGNHDALLKGQLEGFDLRPLTVADFFAQDATSPLPPRDIYVSSLDGEALD